MNVNRDLRPFTTLGFLGSVLVLSALPPETRAQGGLPAAIDVTGIVRDFSRDHPDFDVVPAGGYGHFAGNIGLNEGVDYRPVFVGGGFKVATQWRDRDLNNIAPHLFGAGGPNIIPVVTGPTLNNNATTDSYDPSVGPYGGANVGDAPVFVPGSSMPTITEPTGLPPWVDTLTYSGVGNTTITSDIHCDKFLVSDQHVIKINGDITILVEQEFKLANHARLELQPGATLRLYFRNVATVQDYSVLNGNSADASLVWIYNLGIEPFIVQNQSYVSATLISPNARLHLQDGSNFYGWFVGQTAHLQNSAAFHLAVDGPSPTVCGLPAADSPGTAGTVSSGGITSAATFDQWFRDVLGTNISTYHTITLTNNGSGVYEYLNNDFHPIDGRLLGNEGDANNNYFTFVIEAEFIYQACAGQYFEFRGSDDAWLFVDGKLAIDLGGVLPLMEQHVDMDRLELTDGQTYRFLFFHAQRQPGLSMVDMETNLVLYSLVPTISAAFD